MGRRQRLEGPPHRHRCSLSLPTSPEGSPKSPCLAQPGSGGGGLTDSGPKPCRYAPWPRLVAPRRGSLGRGRPRAGLSPSAQPAPSRVLRQDPSERAAASQQDAPTPRPPCSVHLALRRRASARPPGEYLLRKREERRRHLPTDSGSERRGAGVGPRVRTGERGGARAVGPGVGGVKAGLRTRSPAYSVAESRAGSRAPGPVWEGAGPRERAGLRNPNWVYTLLH